jgi:hypothetical protein
MAVATALSESQTSSVEAWLSPPQAPREMTVTRAAIETTPGFVIRIAST